MAVRNGMRIGIALGDREVVGVLLGKAGAPCSRVPVSLGEEGQDPGVELQRAFAEMKSALESHLSASTDGASVFVSLLPPLADARLVSFPPMRKMEVEAVLKRDVARYFLGANRPHVVGTRLPRANGDAAHMKEGGAIPVLAAAAPLALLESIQSALAQTGWRGASFCAAHGAWLALGSSAKGSLAKGSSAKGSPTRAVVAVIGATSHVLRLEGADPVSVRQVASEDLSAVGEAIGEGSGRVLVLANPQAFEGLRVALASRGLTAYRDPEGWPGAEESTAGNGASALLELVPPTLAMERKEKGRKNALFLVGAAAVLIFASLGAQLWGAHRELRGIQERRSSIRAEVAPLLEARDSLNGLNTQIQSMEELASSAPVWARSLVELTALLPEDTYLTGFFASGDTVELEAAGSQAGEAIQALREAGLFEEVRLQGLVERELEEGETVVERFKLWARMPSPRKLEGGS